MQNRQSNKYRPLKTEKKHMPNLKNEPSRSSSRKVKGSSNKTTSKKNGKLISILKINTQFSSVT